MYIYNILNASYDNALVKQGESSTKLKWICRYFAVVAFSYAVIITTKNSHHIHQRCIFRVCVKYVVDSLGIKLKR